jgi:hypothetical protein
MVVRLYAEYFDSLATLLDSLEDRKNQLIDALDFKHLADEANHINSIYIQSLAHLLGSLGERKN